RHRAARLRVRYLFPDLMFRGASTVASALRIPGAITIDATGSIDPLSSTRLDHDQRNLRPSIVLRTPARGNDGAEAHSGSLPQPARDLQTPPHRRSRSPGEPSSLGASEASGACLWKGSRRRERGGD